MEAENQSLKGLDSFIGAYFGGTASILIGAPLDTIKVRLQVQSKNNLAYAGPWDCTKKIMREEGFLAFYRGAIFPIMSVGFLMSANVGLSYTFKDLFAKLNKTPDSHFINAFLGGGLAGISTSFLGAPFDHLRIRMQAQSKLNAIYKSSWACFKDVALKHGIRGIYKGLAALMLRNSIGCACSFGGYELAKNKIFRGSEGSLLQPIVCGSISGSLFWILSYPVDSVKSRIQVDSLDHPKYRGFYDCYSKTVKHEGYRTLYRGYTPTMLRSMPTNAGFWTTFEFVKNLLNKRNLKSLRA